MLKPNPTKTERDMLHRKLVNIINLEDPFCIICHQIDWDGLGQYFQRFYVAEPKVGWQDEPIRLMVGLLMLKEIMGLSDQAVCADWEDNLYYQYFTGEEYFQHYPPVEPPLLSNFRKRIGKEGHERILQELHKFDLNSIK